jgi:transcriptional regulator with GAF, ATPase, and Fis domain
MKKNTDLEKPKQTKKLLQERLGFEEIISEIQGHIIECSSNDIDLVINDGLKRIGEFFSADFVGLVKMTEPGKLLPGTHIWISEKYDSNKMVSYTLDRKYPNVFSYFLKEEVLIFGSRDEHPDWPEQMEFLNHMGITAGVVVRLDSPESTIELFGINILGTEYSWPTGIGRRILYLGRTITSAIYRKRAERELQKAHYEIIKLKDQLQAENLYLREEIKTEHNFEQIIGNSESLSYALFMLEKFAPTDTTVLIAGETGVGKELFARAVHNASPRKDRPLFKVNCAALTPNLIESELFGHEKGAFTGAHRQQIGRFELADGATLFLDEIGELPPVLQSKLLRVLEEGEFERLGNPNTIKVDVRIITATNRDLKTEVNKNQFREDLYYRLNVFTLTVPSLRERKEDIPLLVNYLVQKFCKKLGKQITTIHKSTMQTLQRYNWPGNVRELENVIERAVVSSPGNSLHLLDKLDIYSDTDFIEAPRVSLDEMERQYISEVLEDTYWRIEGKAGAATILGLHPNTLRARIRKLNIQRPSSRSR